MSNRASGWANTMHSCVLGLAAGLAAFGSAGCAGRLVTSAVQNAIERRLPELIGPAQSYSVAVHGSTRGIMRGRISEVSAQGKGVWAQPDLCLDVLDIRMKDVVADPETESVKSVGEVVFSAAISQESLNRYLARTRPDVWSVELVEGEMVVQGRPKVWRLSADVRLNGHLVPKGDKLYFQVDRLQVAGLTTPSIAAGIVEDRINPVLDLGGTKFSPELKSATIAPGVVRVTGTAHLKSESLNDSAARSYPK